MGNVLPNMSLLQKADLALADLTESGNHATTGGKLLPETAQKFMRILIDESKLLKMATVIPMKSEKTEIPKIRFATRILRAGTEATALPAGDRAKPNLSNVELDTKLFKAEIRLPDEVLEDNIERDQLKATIMQLMGEAISRDMDEIAVQGDTSSADAFLAQFNGILKQSTSNVVDAGVAALNKAVLRDMLKAMPKPFLRNKDLLRYLTSIDAKIDLTDNLGNRQTPMGDSLTMNGGELKYQGVPVEDVPLFPEDLGDDDNTTDVILTDPKNVTVGIWRQIKMETDKDVSAGVVIIVASLRFDVKYAEETATVKAINVKVAA